MKKSIFLFFAAILCSMSIDAYAATQRYIYVGLSNNYHQWKNASQWGINHWGGTGEGVVPGSKITDLKTTITHSGCTFHMYRMYVYDDNKNFEFKGNDSWWSCKKEGISISGTTKNALLFRDNADGGSPTFYQTNYQEESIVSLSVSSNSVSVGEEVTLTPTLTSNAEYNEITSTTYSVGTGATVSNGKFVATAAGTYTVTATITYNPKKFTGITKTVENITSEIVVSEVAIPHPVTSVTVAPTSVTIKQGATTTLTATVAPSNADDPSVTWSSDNQSVATVVNGVVTAVAVGTANITVTTVDGGFTATCAVKVKPLQYTFYAINSAEWPTVAAHYWEGADGGSAWPGANMVKESETINDFEIYSITISSDFVNIMFTNQKDGDQNKKTADLTTEGNDGKYYDIKDAKWYASLSEVPVPFDYYVIGTINGWALGDANYGMKDDNKDGVYEKQITLAAGDHVIKVNDGTWDKQWQFSNLTATYVGVTEGTDDQGNKNGNIAIHLDAETTITIKLNPTKNELTLDGLTIDAPVVTYDYYVVGTINGWGLKDASYGMELSGDVYEKEVAFVIGKHELKINNGAWDNANTFGYDNLSVAYEGVSRGSDDGDNNIVIDLAEAKTITIKLDKNTKKITLEGLTQIHTVTATVNPAEAGTIKGLAADGKYNHGAEATLTAAPAEGYEFTCWTSGKDTVSTVNPYKFTVTADIALVANFQATEPVVELPDASVRAWAYDLALAVEGEQYTFSYKATTAALATLIFTDVDGEELATKDLGLVEAGANTAVLAADELPAGQKVNWAVKLEAGAIANVVEVTDQSRGIYDFYNMMDVLVDNNPESEYFGKIYIQMSLDGKTDGSTERADTQKAGLFIYDQELNELNNPSNVGIKPILPEGYTMGDNRNQFHRLDINPNTGDLTYCYNVKGQPAVFAIDRANLTGEVTNLLSGVEGLTQTAAHCFDAEGALYVMDLPAAGTIYKIVNGVATVFAATDSKWVNASMTLAADGKGGLWVAQNRGQLDSYYQLAHVTSAGVIDWSVYDNLGTFVQNQTPGTSSTGWTGGAARGALAYDAERQLLAQGRNGKVEVYSVAYDAETGVPALTLVASTPTVGTNIDGLHFDYAGDLYVVNSSKEKFQKFAMPTNNNVCTTPAASKYAFQNIEYDTMEITMTNLEVAEMGGYLVLTASDEMETGLNVMLALNEDGSVSEMSYASIISGWMETELPIVEGTITKTYSEELATDVYSGLVVVEYNEGYLGLDLTMYYVAPEYTDIVITNATVTEDIRDLGWGDETYTVLLLESTWSDGVETYPVLVEVNDYDLSVVEGTAVVSVTIGGQGDEDPWLGNVPDGEMKYTIADGVITLQGKLENASAWPAPVYWNLTISGKLPQGPTTALDNIAVEAKAIKMIKNGQLIIIKNGVQYNVQGQVIK